MQKIKPSIEYVPYKTFTVNSLVNPLSNKVEGIEFTLFYQRASLGTITTIGESIHVIAKQESDKTPILEEIWTAEMKNFKEKLIQLYPIPNQGVKSNFIMDNKVIKWALALLLAGIILFILLKKFGTV